MPSVFVPARAVVAAEEALTAGVLENCSTRDQFHELLTRLYNYPKYGLPELHGEPGGVQRSAPASLSRSGAFAKADGEFPWVLVNAVSGRAGGTDHCSLRWKSCIGCSIMQCFTSTRVLAKSFA